MPEVTITRPSVRELLSAAQSERATDLYREAAKAGVNLTTYLDRVIPQSDRRDGLSGFEALLAEANVRVRSVPADGIWASTWEEFMLRARGLMPEYCAAVSRNVQLGLTKGISHLRQVTMSDLEALGSALRPYADDPIARMKMISPPIPLELLVRLTTPIDGDAYRAIYLNEPAAATVRRVRIGQAAEIPRVTLTLGERTVNLYKYGRGMELSYEAARRTRIDKVEIYIQRQAIQDEDDKVALALDVLINGDGNPGTAATSYNQSGLVAGTTNGLLDAKAWTAFKQEFENGYLCNAVLANKGVIRQLLHLDLGSANIPLATVQAALGVGGLRPLNPYFADSVGYGPTTHAPSLKIVGLDTRWALERVVETGADLEELDKFISRQTMAVFWTEVEGYMTLFADAVKILDINA